MASLLQQAVISLQAFNYAFLVVITAVGYDYILTLDKEIEYIWNKPWTWVSMLFVLARYLGLCSVITHCILGAPFFPGSAKSLFQGEFVFLLCTWTFWIFMCAADMVMILRLWALYNRSRLILGTLLTFFAMEIIAYFVAYVMFSARFPNGIQAGTAQVLNYSFCGFEGSVSAIEDEVLDAVQIAFSALMCLLIIIRFVMEALQTYKATKQFQLSRYTVQLAKDGMIYFVAILLFSLMNVLGNTGSIPPGWQLVFVTAIQQIPPFTLIPRFILSLRELYAHDLQARRGSHIDTAFALGSGSWHVAPMSGIMLTDAGPNGEEQRGGGVQMEEYPENS